MTRLTESQIEDLHERHRVVGDGESWVIALLDERAELRAALERIGKRGHLDTCSCSLGAYPCDCHVHIARSALHPGAEINNETKENK